MYLLINQLPSGVKKKEMLKEGSIVVSFDNWHKVTNPHKIKVYLYSYANWSISIRCQNILKEVPQEGTIEICFDT